MNRRKRLIHCLAVLFVVPCLMTLYLAPPAQMQKESAKASMQTKGGLNVVTFDTLNGKVIVNLPDDMMAGDTISGTVVAEPKGNSDEERAKNEAVLNGYVVEVKSPKQAGRPNEVRVPVARGSRLIVFLGHGDSDQASRNTCEVMLLPENKPADFAPPNGFIIVSSTVPYFAPPQGNIIVSRDDKPKLPTIGQQGRPLGIIGPFDGDSSNTNVKIGGQDVPILAESPRKAVFRAPTNVTGPMEITLKEGNKETKGTFRNVGVNLTAPKTTIYKGEIVGFEASVTGLQGIIGTVPLHLTKNGVVTMQGGDSQTIPIKPAEVQANGTFTTTRTITGQQTGAFSVTATVVIFNSCLQDDSNGNTLIFNAETADYILCLGRASLAGANPISLTTMDLGDSTQIPRLCEFTYGPGSSFGGGGGLTTVLTDLPRITKNGAFTSADFNFAGGHIQLKVDDYTHTGSASGYVYQQMTVPSNAGRSSRKPIGKKINFTITDRDTRNNTCACK